VSEALLAELELACFGRGAWTRDQLTASLASERTIVATLATDAYALGQIVVDELELFRIGVRPSARRRGLGQQMFAEFARKAVTMGAAVLHLEVRADNLPALTMYRQLGLQELGRRPRYYADQCDAVLMSMPLGSKGE